MLLSKGRDNIVQQRRGTVANVSKGKRANTLQVRYRRFRWVNRRRCRVPFMS